MNPIVWIYVGIILLGVAGLAMAFGTKRAGADYLKRSASKSRAVDAMAPISALDLNSLTGRTLAQKMGDKAYQIKSQIGEGAILKILLYWFVIVTSVLQINHLFFKAPVWMVIVIALILSSYLALLWLQKRERERFNESFPDALNLLTGAVTAGESLMHAIMFVGRSMDNSVGKEFKNIGERLQIGEDPDEVFARACQHFPYRPFYFFVIALRANMNRGGQLKDVMLRINRLMFDGRALDKKKSAMTSEARMSAKIVALIPFLFIIFMAYFSPDNFNFIMSDPAGRPILYYVLISEAVGIGIIWWLMRGTSE